MEEKIYEVPISEIKIPSGRYRKDFGNIETLADSINTVGQIVPIILTETMALVAGERRIKALEHLKKTTVKAIIRSFSEMDHRITEILENLERKDFTWQEQVTATEDLHAMMKATYGAKWSERSTAAKVGLSVGGVCTDLNLAEVLKEAPDVFDGCESKKQALKALKKYRLDEAMAEYALRKAKSEYGMKAKNIIFNGDCNILIDNLPAKSINCLMSDPIYGIDVFTQRFVNRDLPDVAYEDRFIDSPERFKDVLATLILKAQRVMKDNSCILMFCAFQHAQWLIDEWTKQGYEMDVVPGIWARGANTARTNRPERYFNRCYDMFIYGARGDYTLVKQGTTNVLNVQGVMTTGRDHPTQKPLELMEELISRMCLAGHTVLDPMCGTASTLIAAIKRGCIPIGFEQDAKYYRLGVSNVTKALEMKHAKMGEMIQ